MLTPLAKSHKIAELIMEEGFDMNMMNDLLLGVLMMVLLVVGVVSIKNSLQLPTVEMSNSTGKCVRVIGEGSCESLPVRYHHVWVK